MHHAFWIGVVALIFIVLYRSVIAESVLQTAALVWPGDER